MEPIVRPATEADVPFLAWVQQEAARSHLPSGFWDLAFPGPEEDRLRIVGRICKSPVRSFCHWSNFLVAEVDGKAAAGLSAYTNASVAAGPALTLQCMPKREDLFAGAEYDNPELQLHRHVMFPARAGDMIVVDARGDMGSGIFGEMMLTYLKGRGGAGNLRFPGRRRAEIGVPCGGRRGGRAGARSMEVEGGFR